MPMPAKSAKLQLLNNNPNKKNIQTLKKRAAAEEKMKMATNKLEPPSWLDSVGKSAFQFICDELLSVELVTNPDVYAIAMYSSWYSQYIVLTKQFNKMKREHKRKYKKMKDELGDDINQVDITPELYGNPLSKQMDTCSKNMRSFGSDLGLSPSSRAKLAIKVADQDEDEWQ